MPSDRLQAAAFALQGCMLLSRYFVLDNRPKWAVNN